MLRPDCNRAVNGRQYESLTVLCNCRKYGGSISRILRCGTPLRPRKPVHKRFIQSHAERIWSKAEHEQCGGRCHDNARCESMWARMKNELFYSRGRRSMDYTTEQLKTMIWRYYMSYWNNRRICSSIGGMPPAEKRRRYYSDKTGKPAAAME